MSEMLDTPLASVDEYVALFSRQNIPALRQTVRALAALRQEEESVNGRRIAGIVMGDPLMTIKLLVHLQTRRGLAQNRDITTIDRVVMMMGISPFLKTFENVPTLEDWLAGQPRALLGALQVIGRARTAARYARDWAIARRDVDVDEITVAALLHEATEIACWTFAPELTQRIRNMQAMDHTLRSSVAQKAVLGVTEHEIQLNLIKAWNLPELLATLLDENQAANPRVRNVLLAGEFARHLAQGWENPALPDDIAKIERLLRIGREPLLKRLGTPPEHMQHFMQNGDSPLPDADQANQTG